MIDLIGPAHPAYNDDNVIIGINGYARSGKDTVAKILVERYGFKRFSFADHLRACLYELNPIVGGYWDNSGYDDKYRIMRWQQVINVYGYENYKDTEFGTEMRRLLQVMGTEVGRNMIADDVWVRELDKHKGRIVVPDMRFPNEYEKIVNAGGKVWRIDRPDIKPVNPHVSETAIDDKHFDYHIDNSNTIKALEQEVDHLMYEYGLIPNVL